jgi:histone acetyltransferase (RNA polymerase elongator complex component)
MTYQSKITAFFQPLPHEFKPPIPPRIIRTRQSLITEFFGPEAEQKRKLAAKKAYRERYNLVRKFKKNFHLQHAYQQMLGSINLLCYCRNEYFFYVIDPATNSTIAELQMDSDHWLEHIHVETSYQRRGIGTNLIKFANHFALQEGGNNGIAICVGVDINTRYRLSTEGAALINDCIKKGILQEEQTFHETPPSQEGY